MTLYSSFQIMLCSMTLTSSLMCIEQHKGNRKNLITFKSSDNKYFTLTIAQASIFGIMKKHKNLNNNALLSSDSSEDCCLSNHEKPHSIIAEKCLHKTNIDNQSQFSWIHWPTYFFNYLMHYLPTTTHDIQINDAPHEEDHSCYNDRAISVPVEGEIVSLIIAYARDIEKKRNERNWRKSYYVDMIALKVIHDLEWCQKNFDPSKNEAFNLLIQGAYFLDCPLILNGLAQTAMLCLLTKLKKSPEEIWEFMSPLLPKPIANDFFKRTVRQLLYNNELYFEGSDQEYQQRYLNFIENYLSVDDLKNDGYLDENQLQKLPENPSLLDIYPAIIKSEWEVRNAILQLARRYVRNIIEKSYNNEHDEDAFDSWVATINDKIVREKIIGTAVMECKYALFTSAFYNYEEEKKFVSFFKRLKPGLLKMILRLTYLEKTENGNFIKIIDDIHLNKFFQKNLLYHGYGIDLSGAIKNKPHSYKLSSKPYKSFKHKYTFKELDTFLTLLPLFSKRNNTHIDLSHNRLASIPEVLLTRDNIKHLDLSNNKLEFISPHIRNLKNLECLSLKNNRITHLPEEIGALTMLKKINLKGNNIWPLPKSVLNNPELKKIVEIGLDKKHKYSHDKSH